MGLPAPDFTTGQRSDLHIHSHWSDGALSPEDLAAASAAAGLCAAALTDHAEVRGYPAFAAAAARLGVHAIPGVELNGDDGDLLGLFIDHQNEALLSFLESVRAARLRRIDRTLHRLRELGIPVDPAALSTAAAPGIPSRTTIARELVRGGVCATIDEVFARLLGRRGRAYVPADAPPLDSCLAAITAAGGVAVLAHPHFDIFGDEAALRRTLRRLACVGLAACEVLPPDSRVSAPSWFHAALRSAMADLHLLPVGGSNFHGEGLTAARLGAPSTGGDVLGRLAGRLPPAALHRNFFRRMHWRSVNLTPEEFCAALDPPTIDLSGNDFPGLLDLPPPPEDRPAVPPVPFVLLGPSAATSGDAVVEALTSRGASILARLPTDRYPEIAWTLYGMARGDAVSRGRDLLRFLLDRHLFGAGSARGEIVFYTGLPLAGSRSLKIALRRRIGPLLFHRLRRDSLTDIHFTSHLHMPDPHRLPLECAHLAALGFTPGARPRAPTCPVPPRPVMHA